MHHPPPLLPPNMSFPRENREIVMSDIFILLLSISKDWVEMTCQRNIC